jgi:hypothetical protein
MIPEPDLATSSSRLGSRHFQSRSIKRTHSHDSNSSILLADDEDDEDGAESPDDFKFDGECVSHICCPTILAL